MLPVAVITITVHVTIYHIATLKMLSLILFRSAVDCAIFIHWWVVILRLCVTEGVRVVCMKHNIIWEQVSLPWVHECTFYSDRLQILYFLFDWLQMQQSE